MKAFAMIALAAVFQAASPMPRQTPNSSAGAGQAIQKHPESNQKPAEPPPPVIQTVGTLPDQHPNTANSPKKDEKTIEVSKLPLVSVNHDAVDYLGLAFTFVLLIVGICGVRAAYRTLGEIKAQREAMQGQLTAIQGQLGQMERQATEMEKQTKHLEGSVEVAKDNAKAAKSSADIAAGMALPKLIVHEFTSGHIGAAALPAMLQLPKVNLVIKNYGQTPALLSHWSILFTCEDLPDIPVYKGRLGCGIELTHQVILPDKPYTLTVTNHLHRQGFSINDVQAIIEHDKTLQCYGYVCYGDIFGNPLQRFKFCAMAVEMGDSWIEWRTEYAPEAYIGTDRLPGKHQDKQS